MKKLLQIVMLLLGVMTFTAATVKAQNAPIYRKSNNTFMYTNGQILACFHAASTDVSFTSFYLSLNDSVNFIYGVGHKIDSPSITVGIPIFITESSTTWDIDPNVETLKGGISCVVDGIAFCENCEFKSSGGPFKCGCQDTNTAGPGPVGRCKAVISNTGHVKNFLSQLQQFSQQ